MILSLLGNGLPRDSNVLRPMITGCPEVVRLKNRRSLGRCQSNPLSLPMTLFSAAATMMDVIGFSITSNGSHRYRRLDMRVRLVVEQLEIIVFKFKNIGDSRIDAHVRQRSRFPGQLELHLLEVIAVQVCVAERVDELC